MGGRGGGGTCEWFAWERECVGFILEPFRAAQGSPAFLWHPSRPITHPLADAQIRKYTKGHVEYPGLDLWKDGEFASIDVVDIPGWWANGREQKTPSC